MLTATLTLHFAHVFEPLDRITLDTQFRALRHFDPRDVARDVVVVGVDEDTTRRFPEPIALWHNRLARFLNAMAQAQPAAVGLDVILPERSYDALMPGSDKVLLKGMLELRPVAPLVLALTVDPAGQRRPIYPPFISIAGEGGAGYALFPVDSDGRIRRFDERLGRADEVVPTLAGQLARRLGVEPLAGIVDYWRGKPFDYVPLQQVLQWLDAGDVAQLKATFGGRPVLLGSVLPFTDRHAVPVALAAWGPAAGDTPGVLVQAQALRNMLNDGFIRPVSAAWVVALIAAAALLVLVPVSAIGAAIVFTLAAMAILGGATWLITLGWSAPASGVLVAAAGALGGRQLLETIAQLQERRRLRRSFSGYVSPAVLREILNGSIQPELGGVSKRVCILFSDIRGYTTRSEGMTPQQVIKFLNRYFEQMVAIIHGHGGSVMSFMGDGIMAVFGAPNELESPSRSCFEAALAMLRYVDDLNEEFAKEGEQPIAVGFGLHAGEAVMGHVGSSTRHEYTAIGDVTNVASRLEGLTKEAHAAIVVSKQVAEDLGDAYALRPLGPMSIKGHTPVDVYGYGEL